MTVGAEELIGRALESALKIERPGTRCNGFLEITTAWLEIGQKSKALETLGQALKIVESLKSPDEKCGLLARAARSYAASGDHIRAAELFTRAGLLSHALETAEQKAGALYQIASELALAGLNDQAGKVLAELEATVSDPENGLDVPAELIGIAEIYTDIGELSQTQRVLSEALKESAHIKDNWFRAQRILEIARELVCAKSFEKAALLLEEVYNGANQIDEANQIYFQLSIIDLWIESGNIPRALEILTGALVLADSIELADTRSSDLIDLAERFSQLEDKPKASDLLNQATAAATEAEDPAGRITLFNRISGALIELDETAQALSLTEQAYNQSLKIENLRTVNFLLGQSALLFSKLKQKGRLDEVISRMLQNVLTGKVKTSGLGPIATDLTEAGEIDSALLLADIIKEPEIRASTLNCIGRKMARND